LIGVVLLTGLIWWKSDADDQPQAFVAEPVRETVLESHILRRSTLFQTIKEMGMSNREAFRAIQSAKKVHRLRSIQAGTKVSIFKTLPPVDHISRIIIELEPTKSIVISQNVDEDWTSEIEDKPIEIRNQSFQGRVETSLWESAVEAGIDPNLIVELAEIFAWQVDFSREVRSGDRFRFVVEQKFVGEKSVGWGKILVAEYENSSEALKAIYYATDDDSSSYFFPSGDSLKLMFLKSPIRFGRISSRFQRRRFHPILKLNRPHMGVDYAARPGTPVMAVGDGEVKYVGWKGGGGLTVIIRHNSTYRTAYKHLKAYRKGLSPRKKVKQGDVIGYVGATGLATGPHLHFEFYENGRFVDPLGRKFPSANPVPGKLLEEFKFLAKEKINQLPLWHSGPSLVSSE